MSLERDTETARWLGDRLLEARESGLPERLCRTLESSLQQVLDRIEATASEAVPPSLRPESNAPPGRRLSVRRGALAAPAPRGFTRPAMERMLRELAEMDSPAAEEEPDADYVEPEEEGSESEERETVTVRMGDQDVVLRNVLFTPDEPEEPRQGDVEETFTITTGSGDLRRRWRALGDDRIRGSREPDDGGLHAFLSSPSIRRDEVDAAAASAGRHGVLRDTFDRLLRGGEGISEIQWGAYRRWRAELSPAVRTIVDSEVQRALAERESASEPTPEEIVDEHSVARTPEERSEDLRFVREFQNFPAPGIGPPDFADYATMFNDGLAEQLDRARRQLEQRRAEIEQEIARAQADRWQPPGRVVDLADRLAARAESLIEAMHSQEILRDAAARAAQEIEALARSLRLELGEEPPKPKPRRLSDGPISAERFRGLLDEREEDA